MTNEIPQGSEQCVKCDKIDVLERMHVVEDEVLCDACNEALVAAAEVDTDY